jgi:hypothetical protein
MIQFLTNNLQIDEQSPSGELAIDLFKDVMIYLWEKMC